MNSQPPPTNQPGSSQPNTREQAEAPNGKQAETAESVVVDEPSEQSNTAGQTAVTVAGAVIATAVTIWAVTEYIEEKVIPVILTLAVSYLIIESARNSDSQRDNR